MARSTWGHSQCCSLGRGAFTDFSFCVSWEGLDIDSTLPQGPGLEITSPIERAGLSTSAVGSADNNPRSQSICFLTQRFAFLLHLISLGGIILIFVADLFHSCFQL